jgi:hypothetical protein
MSELREATGKLLDLIFDWGSRKFGDNPKSL